VFDQFLTTKQTGKPECMPGCGFVNDGGSVRVRMEGKHANSDEKIRSDDAE